jgi:[ribosomal protein S5]-alanine N-acetyltransferase
MHSKVHDMLPEFQTERLFMREVRHEDAQALQAFQSRPDQWKLQAIDPEELADGALRIQKYVEHRGPDTQRRLLVFVAHEKSEGELVGQIGLSRFFHPAIGKLSFGVAYNHCGMGYATEMAAQAISFAFECLDLHRIGAEVALENKASRRVLEKIGMTYEGTARDCIWAQGRWWTEASYAILRSDVEGVGFRTSTASPS